LEKLEIPAKYRRIMLDHVRNCLPEEACGLLGGRGERVATVMSVTNQLHSSIKYYMDPVELVKNLHWLDDNNMEILGIYHSHPNGPDHPSETDLKDYLYPTAAALIWYYSANEWSLKAYLIDAKNASEIPIVWISDP
jgi:proteasome lid subunit RPN8/RPN11